jgi:biotin carboxyl carrier protein
MKYVVTLNGKKYEVEVEKATDGAGQKSGQKVLEASTKVAEKYRDASSSESLREEEAVKAPMPGNILSVNVNEGQAVKKGDVLFILEALKMENEIMAERDGVISKVVVSTGTQVNSGDVLAFMK